MATKNISEVFEEFKKAKTKQEKVDCLRKNQSYALINVLQGSLAPYVEFTIKEPVEYKSSDAPVGLGYSSIHQEIGRAYLFEANNPRVSPTLTFQRKKEILIQILESLEAKEAEIFMNMILKKQKIKGLNWEIAVEAFPQLAR